MAWFWICLVLTVLAALAVYAMQIGEEDLFFGLVFGSICNIATLFVAGLVYFGIGGLVIQPLVGWHNSTHRDGLVALSDERTSFGGYFYLGSGYVGSSITYTFYYSTADGGRHLVQTDPTDVTVFEDAPPDKPYVVWKDAGISNHPGIIDIVLDDSSELKEIHVPPHSIKQGIQLGVPDGKQQ